MLCLVWLLLVSGVVCGKVVGVRRYRSREGRRWREGRMKMEGRNRGRRKEERERGRLTV